MNTMVEVTDRLVYPPMLLGCDGSKAKGKGLATASSELSRTSGRRTYEEIMTRPRVNPIDWQLMSQKPTNRGQLEKE
jgi:hypothetical protein